LLWAIVLAIVFYPLHARFLKLFKGRKTWAALVTVLITFVVTVGPMVFFAGTLVREILQFYADVGAWIAERRYEIILNRVLDSPLRVIWDKIVEKTASLDIEILPLITHSAQAVSEAIVGQIQSGAKNFVFFVLNYIVTIIIFFFFLRDGQSMALGLK